MEKRYGSRKLHKFTYNTSVLYNINVFEQKAFRRIRIVFNRIPLHPAFLSYNAAV